MKFHVCGKIFLQTSCMRGVRRRFSQYEHEIKQINLVCEQLYCFKYVFVSQNEHFIVYYFIWNEELKSGSGDGVLLDLKYTQSNLF